MAEDSDAWLADSGAELEAELQRAQAAAEGGGGIPAAPAAVAQLDQIPKRMQVQLQVHAGAMRALRHLKLTSISRRRPKALAGFRVASYPLLRVVEGGPVHLPKSCGCQF